MRRAIYQTLRPIDIVATQPTNLPSSAYSVRLVNTSYTGAAIRVRRSGDNAELDIGFSAVRLNLTALTAFCGSNNGFIAKWYDQMSGRDLVSSGSSQPQIVFNGVVGRSNSIETIYFAPSGSMLAPAPLVNLNEFDLFFVHAELGRRETTLYDFTGSSTLRGSAHAPWSDGNFYFDTGNIQTDPNARISASKPTPVGTLAIPQFSQSTTSNTKSIRANGAAIATGSASMMSPICTKFQIGFNTLYNNGVEATISEILIYNRLLSTVDRTQLITDIRTYYNI